MNWCILNEFKLINGKYVLIVFKVDYKDINRINYYENEEELGYEFKKINIPR